MNRQVLFLVLLPAGSALFKSQRTISTHVYRRITDVSDGRDSFLSAGECHLCGLDLVSDLDQHGQAIRSGFMWRNIVHQILEIATRMRSLLGVTSTHP
jgi:hypothetical protein